MFHWSGRIWFLFKICDSLKWVRAQADKKLWRKKCAGPHLSFCCSEAMNGSTNGQKFMRKPPSQKQPWVQCWPCGSVSGFSGSQTHWYSLCAARLLSGFRPTESSGWLLRLLQNACEVSVPALWVSVVRGISERGLRVGFPSGGGLCVWSLNVGLCRGFLGEVFS